MIIYDKTFILLLLITMIPVGAIFTGIIIAVVSSWITVQLSLKKFQKEKLWERKLEAYKNH